MLHYKAIDHNGLKWQLFTRILTSYIFIHYYIMLHYIIYITHILITTANRDSNNVSSQSLLIRFGKLLRIKDNYNLLTYIHPPDILWEVNLVEEGRWHWQTGWTRSTDRVVNLLPCFLPAASTSTSSPILYPPCPLTLPARPNS